MNRENLLGPILHSALAQSSLENLFFRALDLVISLTLVSIFRNFKGGVLHNLSKKVDLSY